VCRAGSVNVYKLNRFSDCQERARRLREKMLEEERLREWSRPREDLELDDLKVVTCICSFGLLLCSYMVFLLVLYTSCLHLYSCQVKLHLQRVMRSLSE